MPPGLMKEFGDNNMWGQALIMAYDQIRGMETDEWEMKLAGAKRGT